MKKNILSIIITIPPLLVQADTQTDKLLNDFLKNAELCEHFSSEFDPESPKKRRNEIIKKTNKYCSEAQQQKYKILTKKTLTEETKNILNKYESVTYFSNTK